MLVNIKIQSVKENHSVDNVIEQVALHYKRDTDEFKQGLKQAINTPELARPILQDLDQNEADQACAILAGFGLICEQEAALSLSLETIEKKHQCPACNHEQTYVEDGGNVCGECGVVASKFSQSSKKRIYEEEKQKLDIAQRRANTDLERQKEAQEEQLIRDDIQAQLGIKKKSSGLNSRVSFAVVAVLAVGTVAAIQSGFVQSYLVDSEVAEETKTAEASSNEGSVKGSHRVNLAAIQAAATLAANAEQNSADIPVNSDQHNLQQVQSLLVTPESNNDSSPLTATAVTSPIGSHSVSAQASAKTYQQAFVALEAITDPEAKSEAIRTIVSSAVNQTHSEATLELLEKQFRGFSHADTQKLGQQIVNSWLDRGNVQHAFQSALTFRDEYQKSEAIRTIVFRESARNDSSSFDTALESLHQILSNLKLPHQRAHVLSTISYIHLRNSDAVKSEKFLDLAFDESDLALRIDHKIDALNRIGEDRLALEDTELGLHIFDNVKNLASGLSKYNPAKSRAFKIIALGLARSGNFIDAKQSVTEILDRKIRNQTLLSIAELAATSNKPEIASVFLEMREPSVLVGTL